MQCVAIATKCVMRAADGCAAVHSDRPSPAHHPLHRSDHTFWLSLRPCVNMLVTTCVF